MTDKQINEADENMLKLNDICISCISEIGECECRKVAEDLYFKLLRKEQECEELKEARKNSRCAWKSLEGTFCPEAQEQLDQLKAEVKSKTEYIQEQRDIINQYSKEIEMYKKCQGKRASKREEELKAENERLKQAFAKSDTDCFRLEKENNLLKVYRSITPLKVKKLVQTINEIKEIALWKDEYWSIPTSEYISIIDEILQKISEVEDGN